MYQALNLIEAPAHATTSETLDLWWQSAYGRRDRLVICIAVLEDNQRSWSRVEPYRTVIGRFLLAAF